jgi:hypothetical protein
MHVITVPKDPIQNRLCSADHFAYQSLVVSEKMFPFISPLHKEEDPKEGLNHKNLLVLGLFGKE